jgi:hypothetical protein
MDFDNLQFTMLCQEEGKHKLALETMVDGHLTKIGG